MFVDKVVSVEKKKFQLVDRFFLKDIYHGYCDTLASVSPSQYDKKKTRKEMVYDNLRHKNGINTWACLSHCDDAIGGTKVWGIGLTRAGYEIHNLP